MAAQFQVTLRDYLQIFFHRVWVIAGLLVVSVVLSVGYAYTRPDIYRASNEVRVVNPYDTNPNLQNIVKKTSFQQRLDNMIRGIQSREGLEDLIAGVDGLATAVPLVNAIQARRVKVLEKRMKDAEGRRGRYTSEHIWPPDRLAGEQGRLRERIEATRALIDDNNAQAARLRELEQKVEYSRENSEAMATEELRELRDLRAAFRGQEELAGQFLGQVQKLMSIGRPSQQYVVVAFESTSPIIAADAVDQIVDMLEDLNESMQRGEVDTSKEVLETKVAELERRVAEHKKEIEGYAELDPLTFHPFAPEQNMDQVRYLSQPKDTVLAEYQELQRRLNEVIADQAATDRVVRQLERRTNETDVVIVTEETTAASPTLRALQENLALDEARLAGLLTRRSDQHPMVVELRAKIQSTRRMLESGGPQLVTERTTGRNPVFDRLQEQLDEARSRHEALDGRRRELSRLSEIAFDKLKSLPKRVLEGIRLQQEYQSALHSLNLFRSKLEEARITEDLEVKQRGTRLLRQGETLPPRKPVRPNRMLLIMIGMCLGLFGAGGAVFFMEYADHSVRGIIDARRFIDLPVLGAISEYEMQQEEIRKLLGLKGVLLWVRAHRVKVAVIAGVLILVLSLVAARERIQLWLMLHSENGATGSPQDSGSGGRTSHNWRREMDVAPTQGAAVGAGGASAADVAAPVPVRAPEGPPPRPSSMDAARPAGAAPGTGARPMPGPLPSGTR